MIINCYYDELTDNPSREEELINIWKKSWSKFGWKPNVLSKENIKVDKSHISKLENLPTVNNRGYENACYLRWLAMSQIGGGWMCDYDVVNNGFTPLEAKLLEKNKLIIFQKHVPSLVYGDMFSYERIFNIFCDDGKKYIHYVNEKEHTSDMVILSYLSKLNEYDFIAYENIVSDYPNLSKLIHCSNFRCSQNSISKKEAMLKLLNNHSGLSQY